MYSLQARVYPLIPPPIKIPVDEPPFVRHIISVEKNRPVAKDRPVMQNSQPQSYDFPVPEPYTYDRCMMCSILLHPSRISCYPFVCTSCVNISLFSRYPICCSMCICPAWRIHRSCGYAMCNGCLYHWANCPRCMLPMEE